MLDPIEPGGAGWREVDMATGKAGQPRFGRSGFVGCIVVHHQVEVEVDRHSGFECTREVEEFPTAMALKALSCDLSGGDDEGRGKCGRACAA